MKCGSPHDPVVGFSSQTTARCSRCRFKTRAMCARRIHTDEVGIDVSLLRRLLATQFPQWADLSIEPVDSAGADNVKRDISPRRRHGCAIALHRKGYAAGGQGTRVADEAGTAPAAGSAGPAGEGGARQGPSVALVRCPVAPRRERDGRTHHRSTPGCGRPGAVHCRAATDRSHRRATSRGARLSARRTAGTTRSPYPRGDTSPGRHA